MSEGDDEKQNSYMTQTLRLEVGVGSLLKDMELPVLEALGCFVRGKKTMFFHWDSKPGEGTPETVGHHLGVRFKEERKCQHNEEQTRVMETVSSGASI